MKYQISFLTNPNSILTNVHTIIIEEKSFFLLSNGFWVDANRQIADNPSNFISYIMPHMITNITARHDLEKSVQDKNETLLTFTTTAETFCIAHCINTECFRHFNNVDKTNLPISYANMKDKCKIYQEAQSNTDSNSSFVRAMRYFK